MDDFEKKTFRLVECTWSNYDKIKIVYLLGDPVGVTVGGPVGAAVGMKS